MCPQCESAVRPLSFDEHNGWRWICESEECGAVSDTEEIDRHMAAADRAATARGSGLAGPNGTTGQAAEGAD